MYDTRYIVRSKLLCNNGFKYRRETCMENIYNIAIVEDETECVDKLKECLEEYSIEKNIKFNITVFNNGSEFIFNYNRNIDIIFMDVQMPKMNGFVTAKELRKIDEEVVLVFVTHLSKYAYKGYEVSALDYVLKPVNYAAFKLKIDRAIMRCEASKLKQVMLPTTEGAVRVSIKNIFYVEIDKHNILYHTAQGEYHAYGTLKQIEKILPNGFSRCNSCYLVNLRCVTKMQSDDVYIGDIKLSISRSRKKEFVKALYDYIMEGN